jgi:membrane protease YdiL (CAAX protease family)
VQTKIFTRAAVAIWLGAVIGTACVMPYVNALTPALHEAAAKKGIPLGVLLALSIVQSAVLLGVMTFVGLWAARKIGLGAPLLDHWLDGKERPPTVARTALVALALGIASGIVLVALDVFVFLPPGSTGSAAALLNAKVPPAWMGFLASFEGAITEEVELRLFLLSLLALGLCAVLRKKGALPASVFWIANVVAAVLFGLGHLPTTAQLVALTPLIVTRAIVLNGIVGVVAGVLYWKRGIEMAMVCHFGGDLVLHVAAPLLAPLIYGPAS